MLTISDAENIYRNKEYKTLFFVIMNAVYVSLKIKKNKKTVNPL